MAYNNQLNLRYKITFVLASCLIFFLIPELCLRTYVKMASKAEIASYDWINPKLKLDILENSYLEPDPLLYWRLKPKKNGFASVNSMGTRGKEFLKNKSSGVFRIICMGDSSTFGSYIGANNTYPMILQKLLNSRQNSSQHYEVINAGIPGYGTYQGMLYLQKKIISWQPDLVTVYLGHNQDYAINRYFDFEPLVKWPVVMQINNFLDQNYLYNLIKSLLLKIKIYLLIKTRKGFSIIYRKSKYEMAKTHLLNMAKIAREQGFKIIFLNYLVNAKDFGQGYLINRMIEAVSYEAKVPLVDVTKIFKDNTGKNLFFDNVHPNIFGHRLIAEAIFKTLLDEGIIN